MNILLIGVGYFPYLTAGEKNFFFRLLPILKQQVNVNVFSLNDHAEQQLTQETPFGDIPVYCARRPFHTNYEQYFFPRKGYTGYHHRHKFQQEIPEKFISTLVSLPRLRKIINNHQIQLIHFMDNFGPAMPVLGGLFPRVKVTYSAANYQPRGSKRLYDFYLKSSINPIDGAGVYTHAYKAILRDLGIRTPLRMTRWGVNLPDRSMNAEQKETIRSELNLQKGEKFLLWSGFIQQIKDHDFFATIKIAHEVVKNNPKINFLFAFKPESYRPDFANEANEKIKVASNIENFAEILEAADFFLSPVGNELSTVSPPLTWIEALSRGTPVITTSVGGADEVVIHKKTGYLAKDYDRLEDMIHQAVNDSDLDEMSTHAKTLVREEFNLQASAKAYQEFWEEMIG